jgi:hypothetical protein
VISWRATIEETKGYFFFFDFQLLSEIKGEINEVCGTLLLERIKNIRGNQAWFWIIR